LASTNPKKIQEGLDPPIGAFSLCVIGFTDVLRRIPAAGNRRSACIFNALTEF
jgi:hypothetical protein